MVVDCVRIRCNCVSLSAVASSGQNSEGSGTFCRGRNTPRAQYSWFRPDQSMKLAEELMAG